MKMHKPSETSDNLIDLYTRIPDYSEVQHLGQSDFINTLEKLKEEFRQCRASLYNEEFCSDSEFLAGKSSPINSRSKTTDNLCYYSSKYNNNTSSESKLRPVSSSFRGLGLTFDGTGKATKINNHNFTTLNESSGSGAVAVTNPSVSATERNDRQGTESAGGNGAGQQYLSVKSCELHRTPYRSSSALSLTSPSRFLSFGRPTFGGGGNLDSGKNDSAFHDDDDDYEDDDDDEVGDNGDCVPGRDGGRWSIGSSNSDLSLSKWSSNPEIYRARSKSKEFLPPSNVEQRLLMRKSQNNSAPSVAFKDEPEETQPVFKANPVPEHVYKPLYEFIMLKNQRRSERVKEQSKRRLLAQVKPFSFYKNPNRSSYSHHHHPSPHHERTTDHRSGESLNNTKPLRKRRNDAMGNIKTNNNRLTSASLFKAKPAPPRTKALLAAIRQKEQQEYRELKKRLRAELLLKNASLPPSMAAREKRTKLTNAKIDEVLHDYQKSFSDKRKGMSRNFRETSTGTDDTGLLTDEDRMTEDEFGVTTKKITTVVRPFKLSLRSPRKFTSFGTSRHSAASVGVFESSSNDNHASRLRYQAAKIKEQLRMKREEEELLKILRGERRRQKLRDGHLHAWQHACSYSAEQDIAMRRQLRHAASILERESFVRDMSCMLSRVRSAPLLLEGGNRLERKQEPCKKHREELKKHFSNNSADRPWNKLSSTPRLYSSNDWRSTSNKQNTRRFGFDRYGEGEEKSETLALAEGSLSNSDNESGHEDNDREQIHTDSEDGEEDEGEGTLENKEGKVDADHIEKIEGKSDDPGLSTDDDIHDEVDGEVEGDGEQSK